MKLITNSSYISNESCITNLFYKRSTMRYGEKIPNFKYNTNLITGITTCDYIVADMFWNPIGDSFLFLSVLKAAEDYINLVRKDNPPKWVIGSKFSNLLLHINFLRNAKVVDSGVEWFKLEYKKGNKVVLVTDTDPFSMGEYNPIFNSENYKYPKFIENRDKKVPVSYSSRPARYYLTFEREVGRILLDPNNSIPLFTFKNSPILNKKITERYSIDLTSKDKKYIALISQTKKVEKKFGSLRYLALAKRLIEYDKNIHILFIANKDEESPKEWLQVLKILNNKKITLLDTSDFEELSYAFSRCSLVIGNDTGFSHLSAMSKYYNQKEPTKTMIIYSDHDYSKWCTGKSNVIPVTSKLSRYLAKNSFSVRRGDIDLNKWDKYIWAYNISVSKVFKQTIKLL